jgi:two-component sensor histidine kinase
MEARPAFDEVAQRIATVGRVYEHVHRQDDLAELDLADYLRGICVQIGQSAARDDVRLETELDAIHVDIDIALPVGLVAGELVTNAYKHAFPADRGGTITVRLSCADGQATLQVQDDGIGIDPDRLARSAGLRIAEALAGQVDGTLRFANRPQGGAEVTLTFRAK